MLRRRSACVFPTFSLLSSIRQNATSAKNEIIEESSSTYENSPSTTSSSSSSWGDFVSSSVASAWTTVTPLAKSFEGVQVTSPEQIRQNTPQWYHPVRRMRYRKYLLEQEQKLKEQEQLQSLQSMVMSSLRASMSTNECAPAASMSTTTTKSLNISEQIKKLGLDPQSTISVLLVYIGFWCAVLYYGLSVLYFSFYFRFFNGGLPQDPKQRQQTSSKKDEHFDPEFFGSLTTSFTKNNGVNVECDSALTKQIHDQLTKFNKLVILHSIPGCGKSTFTRWLSNEFAQNNIDNKQISDVIYVRINSNNITACDPLDVVGEYYGISSHHNNVQHVFSILNLFSRIKNLINNSNSVKKPLLVFDIGLLPNSSSLSSLSSSEMPNKSNASSSSSGFDLATFMNKVHALASDSSDKFSILVSVDSTLLHTQVPRSITQSDSVSIMEMAELDDRRASNLVSKMTDQYVQSLMPFAKKTPKFLKEKLVVAMKNDANGDERNPMQIAKELVGSEYKKMENSISAVFASCKEESKLRSKASSQKEITWTDVENHCANKYSSNAHFRMIADLEHSVFTPTGPSTYRPTLKVIGEKILANKKFMEK